MSKKLILLITIKLVLMYASSTAHCQSDTKRNLVRNHSFEVLKDTSDWAITQDFVNAVENWTSPTSTTPDLIRKFSSQAHSGNVMAGFFSYKKHSPNRLGLTRDYPYREYIKGALLHSLKPGYVYELSMFVHAGNGWNYCTNNVGVLFCTQNLYFSADKPIYAQPNINFENIINNIDDNWMELKSTFVAIDTFKYLIIGNFFDDTELKLLPIDTLSNRDGAYYLVDDISLHEVGKYNKTTSPSKNEPPKPSTLSIYFKHDSDELLTDSLDVLNTFIEKIKNLPYNSINVVGFASKVGDRDYNNHLSARRAKKVRDYLMNSGLSNISYEGSKYFGDYDESKTELELSLDRRVDIIVKYNP